MAVETGSADASTGAAEDDDPRERVKRGLLYALAMTPILGSQFALGSVDPVSTGAILVAVPSGTVLGVVTVTVVEWIEFEPEGELRSIAILLVLVVVVVALSWILVPANRLGTFLVVTLAFIWASALATATRHVVIPWIGAREQ